MNPHLHSHRGVSLLESLVAMAVMSIGAVAVVGLQSTLRLNGDVAKQRAEAVRLAQEVIESWRGFTSMTAVDGAVDWTDIVSTGTTAIAGANATFNREVTVVASGAADDNPLSKTVHVRVWWTDRANETQSVALNSIITGSHPALGGSLSVPMSQSAPSRPLGRHPAVPRAAIDQGDGTSLFTPPGGSVDPWVFNNATGVITGGLCPNAESCADSDYSGLLLSGFVRFATDGVLPTAAQGETPGSAALPVQVWVNVTYPEAKTVNCVEETGATWVAYYCAIPVPNSPSGDPPQWSGRLWVDGIPMAAPSEIDVSKYKLCRYTTNRTSDMVENSENPLDFNLEGKPMGNKNFLVIHALSNVDNAPLEHYGCPDDDAGTSNIDGTTRYHPAP